MSVSAVLGAGDGEEGCECSDVQGVRGMEEREETRRGQATGVTTELHAPSSMEGELEMRSIMSSSRSPSSSMSSSSAMPPFWATASESCWCWCC